MKVIDKASILHVGVFAPEKTDIDGAAWLKSSRIPISSFDR